MPQALPVTKPEGTPGQSVVHSELGSRTVRISPRGTTDGGEPKGAEAPSDASRRLADNVVEELWFGDDDPIRTHIQASASLAAATALATGLKPFPVVAQRVLNMTQNSDSSISDLCRLLERDPGLTARVLRVANSALYAPTRACASIEHAALRLGLRNIGRIVVTLVAHGMFSDTDARSARIREHCVGVSILARRLAAGVRAIDADDLFLAGLLHDIGKLLAMQTQEIDYGEFEGGMRSFCEDAHLRERQLVGWDHAVLGAHVIEHWQLPRHVATIVAWHHQPSRAFSQGGAVAQAVALLRLADRIEYQILVSRELDESFVGRLERESAFEYTEYDATLLQAAWTALVSVVDEGKAIIGARA